jgi:uncharacterized C2H2 Zn-finger protein
MEVFQCPECQLRFRDSSELEQHLALDHPDFQVTPKTVEDALISAAHRRRHARPYRRDGDGGRA